MRKHKSASEYAVWALMMALLLAHVGCSKESDERIREKLEVILEDDLQSLSEQLPKQSVADSVYFMVQSYESFDEGKYSRKAEVDFFFLKDNIAKVIRKYRYHNEFLKWERYFNKYELIYDTTSTKE